MNLNPNAPQLQRLTQPQTEMLHEYGADLAVPPFCDTTYFERRLPSPEIVQDNILGVMEFSPDLSTVLADAVGAEAAGELMQVDPVSLSEYKTRMKGLSPSEAVPNGNDSIANHWRGLVNGQLPEGSTFRFAGNYCLLSYNVGLSYPGSHPSQISVLFDLSRVVSDKARGISMKGIYQERPRDGMVWDVLKLAPSQTEAYFRDKSFIVKLTGAISRLVGLNISVGATAGTETVMGRTFGVMNYYGIYPGSAIDAGHEAAHLWQRYGDNLDRQDWANKLAWRQAKRYASVLGTVGAELTFLSYITRLNPWIGLVPFLSSISLYFISRLNNNSIGSGFHYDTAIEREAYFVEAVLARILANNGFAPYGGYQDTPACREDLETVRPLSAPQFYFAYEPSLWAYIDTIVYSISETVRKHRENPAPLPVPNPAGLVAGTGAPQAYSLN